MGVYWRSYAEIISTEPEVIKQLVEEAATEDITVVCDLKIDDNHILFNSYGYGCYGTDFEDPNTNMLFEFLFENYDKALVCFEMVEPCQSQGYYFSASWAKPDGKVDWDDDETFYIYHRAVFEDPDGDEGEFDIADTWFVPIEHLEKCTYKYNLQNLAKLVDLAKERGFTDWATNPDKSCGYDRDSGVLMNTIWEIADYLKAGLEEHDKNLECKASYEIEQHCLYWVSEIEIDNEYFELPENFPVPISTFDINYKKEMKQKSKEIDEASASTKNSSIENNSIK